MFLKLIMHCKGVFDLAFSEGEDYRTASID